NTYLLPGISKKQFFLLLYKLHFHTDSFFYKSMPMYYFLLYRDIQEIHFYTRMYTGSHRHILFPLNFSVGFVCEQNIVYYLYLQLEKCPSEIVLTLPALDQF